MLSQRSRYALKALTYLARGFGEGPRQVTGIADTENIPRKFLEAIMGDMKRSGLVVSARGKFGGYELAREPDKITYGHIIRAPDGPLDLGQCVRKQFYRTCDGCSAATNVAPRQNKDRKSEMG